MKALIIGQTIYSPPRVNLPRAVVDAQEIAQMLSVRFGFKTSLHLDDGADLLTDHWDLIYWAGHGEVEGIVVGNQIVSLRSLRRPECLTILDCCLCGHTIIPSDTRENDDNPAGSEYLSLADGLVWCASCGPAYDTDDFGVGSIFAKCLIENLKQVLPHYLIDQDLGLRKAFVEMVHMYVAHWCRTQSVGSPQVPVIGVPATKDGGHHAGL